MVDTKAVTQALGKLKESSSHIKFNQSVDLVVTLKDLDLKKPENQVDFYFNLPNGRGKPIKVCGLVGSELVDESKRELDLTISESDFASASANKAKLKAMASEFDFFVAQANVMTKVAQHFGRVLGPRGKMPNPKAGCVVPPKVQLGPVKSRLEKTLRVVVKKSPHIQLTVGTQEMDPQQVVENISESYAQIVSHLPQGINNVKRVYIKYTMSPIQRVM